MLTVGVSAMHYIAFEKFMGETLAGTFVVDQVIECVDDSLRNEISGLSVCSEMTRK